LARITMTTLKMELNQMNSQLANSGMLDMNMDEFGLEEEFGLDSGDMPSLPTLGNPFETTELAPLDDDMLGNDPTARNIASSVLWKSEQQQPSIKQEICPRQPSSVADFPRQPNAAAVVPAQDISPAMSVPGSPEQDDSGSGSDGCRTPPKSKKSRKSAMPTTTGTKRKTPASEPAFAELQADHDLDLDFSSSSLGPMAYDPKQIEAQRELRLKRNREAAQQFRKRKKEYIQSLERDCDRLRQENMQLRARVSSAGSENGMLRQENAFLQRIVNQRPAPAVHAEETGSLTPVGRQSRRAPAKKLVAGAMAALMVIGVVFQASQPSLTDQQFSSVPALIRDANGGASGSPAGRAAAAMARRRLKDADASEVVPLPGAVWNWSLPAAAANTSASAAINGTDAASTWLSLFDGGDQKFSQKLAFDFSQKATP
jgi:hypothetical protein